MRAWLKGMPLIWIVGIGNGEGECAGGGGGGGKCFEWVGWIGLK
jgi:hypothetical protein